MTVSRDNLITILYGNSAMIAPVDLSDGEFAFSNGSKKLFIGSGGDSTVNWVGAVIDNDITIDWYGLSSENNKLATQYAILSIFSSGAIEDVNISGGIVFEGQTADDFETTLSAADPTEDRTIYLPDASGTLALVPGSDTQVVFNDNDVLGTDAGLTYNKSTDTLTVAGDLAVNGGDITTTSTATFNIVNSNATGIYLGTGAATDVRIGKIDNAGTTRLYGTVGINGGTLTTSNASSSIFDTTATTLDIGGAATTLTIGHDGTSASTTNIATGAISSGTKAVSIGTGSGASTTTNISMGSTNGGTTNIYSPTVNIGYASSGTTTLNSSTVVGASATQTLYNTVATTMNFAGAATTLTMGGTSGGTTALRNAETKLGVTTAQITTNGGTTNALQLGPYGNLNLVPTTTAANAGGTNTSLIITNANDGAGTVTVAGGDLVLSTKDTDEFTTSAVNIIFEGATDNAFKTTLTVTDPTANRTITLPNATGTVALIAGSDTYVLFNDGGVVGGDSGLTYNKTTDALTVTGDIAVNGGDITSSAVTFNLLNSTVTTMNLGGAATAITMGDATTATTTIRGATLVGNTATQNLFNTTATTLNLGGAATSLSIGAVTGTATINNANTVVTGDLAVNGGDITTTAATATLMNATATTLSVGGAATTLTIGATSGTALIRNATTKFGNTTASITTTNTNPAGVNTNHLTIAPQGNLILAPTNPLFTGASTRPSVVITSDDLAAGTVTVAGGDLYLSTKDADGPITQVNIIFEGATADGFETTLTVTDPTADRTITLPNATGTVALIAGSDTYVLFNDGGVVGGDSGLAYNKTTDALTVTGDLAVNGGDITTSAATATLMNATATNLSVGGAATTLTIGATSGTTALRNLYTKLGTTTAGLSTNSGTTNSLTVYPYGDLILAPITTAIGAGGTNAQLTITNTNDGVGTVTVAGGDLYLGTKNTTEFNVYPVNIIFEGATDNAFDTTLTVTDPTANRTITLPNLTGTVALTTDLSQFAATSSAQLAGVISDETGSGLLVFATSPTLVTPILGAAAATSLTTGNTGVKVGEHASRFLTITSDGTNNEIIQNGNSTLTIKHASYGEIYIGDSAGVNNNTYILVNDNFATITLSGAVTADEVTAAAYILSSASISAKTASYTLVATDNGKIIIMNVASANNLTVPASLAVGFNCTVIQIGAGQTTIVASGTTLNSYQSALKISGQHGSASIISYVSNVYNVSGSLVT